MTREPLTLVDMLRGTADEAPADHGVLFYDTPDDSSLMSYRELDQQARAIAAALTRRGFAAGDIAVMAFEPGHDFFRAAYGAFYAGLIIVPAAIAGVSDAGIISGRIAALVDTSGARLVVTQPSVIDGLAAATTTTNEPTLAGMEVTTPAVLLDEGDADSWVAPDLDPDAVAALMYTSGSTGNPKGVILTHGAILENARTFSGLIGATADSTFVGWMPLHHGAGLMVQVVMPAFAGARAVLTPTAQFQRRPMFWLQLISDHRATYTMAANFAFGLCAQLATDEQITALDLTSLECIMSGAEPVRMETIRAFVDRFGKVGAEESKFMPVMAMTEAISMATKRPGTPLIAIAADAVALEENLLENAGGSRSLEIVSCGEVVPGHTLAIVDPDAETLLADGRIGEIWVSGPGVSAGYWQNPAATAEAFGNRLPGDDRRYLRSGDLGGIIDGQLFVTGRLKDLIIVRGRNIYPQDLEAAAMRLPAVGIGAAFELTGHPCEVGIVLEFDPEQRAGDDVGVGIDTGATVGAIRTLLMSEFSLPSLAVALIEPGTLPRTASGKVRRAVTRTMLEDGALELRDAEGFAAASMLQRRAEPTATPLR